CKLLGPDDRRLGGLVLFGADRKLLRPEPIGIGIGEGQVVSVAIGPQGIIAAAYPRGVVLLDAKGERLRSRPIEVKKGSVMSVAFGPGGKLAVGIAHDRAPWARSGSVAQFETDPISWRRKLGFVANRNLTWKEWTESFPPDRPYHRTMRSLPWPHDLPEAVR